MRKRYSTLLPLLLPVVLSAQSLNPVRIGLHNYATQLNGPISLTHVGDDRLFVAEQVGRIRIITDSMVVAATPFLDIQNRVNDTGSEQGLLSLVFSPDYATSGHFYVYYTAGSGAGTSRISRFSVTEDPNVADPDSEEILYTWPQPFSNHNGADLHFGPDGYLYCGFGDGGSGDDPQNNAQDLTDPLGDMIRIDVSLVGDTFGIPEDNPYATAGGDTLPEIWATGLRNPWRFSFDSETGDMWIGDVGQNAWEEVDFWPAGDNSGPNFGWRCREGLVATPGVSQVGCLPAASYVGPVAVFSHSSPVGWCSVIGGYVYRGTKWPNLLGKYIFTDYCGGDFLTFGEEYDLDTLLSTGSGYTAFGQGPDGELYVMNSTQVRKIYDACPMPDPTITFEEGAITASEADGYQWYFNGSPISGAIEQTYTPLLDGIYHVVADFGGPCELRSDTLLVFGMGVAERNGSDLRLYPQPATDELFIDRTSTSDVLYLQLVDATGRVMGTAAFAAGQQRARIGLDELANGTYVLRAAYVDGVTFDHYPVMVVR
jgi:glucose/arabinose dehydrogenase